VPFSSPSLGQLDILFAQRKISRRQFVAGLAALGVTASTIDAIVGSDPIPANAQTPVAQYLVLIVLDAFRADYFSPAVMPTLDALIRSGVSYDQAWVGHLQSETPTGHATISTGSMPRTHQIIGFEWRDPVTGLERLDGWAKTDFNGSIEQDLHASGVPSIPGAFKLAHPEARIVALSSEKVYAADAMGGTQADYILFHRRTAQGHLIPRALSGHVPPQDFFQHPHLREQFPMKHFTDWDYLSAELALASIDALKPQVLMVNLPGADVYGHTYGGTATPAVMNKVIAGLDRNLARIVDAYKSAGIYRQTLFVVTADHGMVPNSWTVDRPVVSAGVTRAGGQVFFQTGGTAPCIYIHNPKRSKAVSRQLAQLPAVAASYYLQSSVGQYAYQPAPGTKVDPSLDAAYRYLLGTFAGPSAPDVVIPLRENAIPQAFTRAHGDHGGTSWGSQHIPLILVGPGVPAGVVSHHPARLVDLAPTILRLLGLPVQKMEGTVIADALISPAAADVASQTQIAAAMNPLVAALRQQSADNIAEDAKTGHHAPPSAPLQPST
jgi:hypothetical protein